MSGFGYLVERAVTLLVVVLISPLFFVVAAMVLIRDGRPVVFRQSRVGRDGELFEILKFRTMAVNEGGPLITGGGDARVTANGALLRRTKLDELPQLWNVVRGEMRLVGPRPEVAKYVEMYDAEQRRVLGIPPGITDVASLAFRNEEALLEASDDPAVFYIEKLMPAKIRLNLNYAARRNFFTDVGVIVNTVLVVTGCKAAPLPPAFSDDPQPRADH